MLGEFIIKILVLVFGYLYPALRCFEAIERHPTTDHLRFWCQYWVIIAVLTAIEKFGDIFISWLPLYGESKLAFIVYLWHPRTMGTNYVYNTFLKPFMAEHETEIEQSIQQMMSKSIDLLVFYFKNFTEQGQSVAFKILDYVLSKPWRSSSSSENRRRPPSPPPSARGKRRSSPPPPAVRPSPPAYYPPPPSSSAPSAPPLQPGPPPPSRVAAAYQPATSNGNYYEGEEGLDAQVNKVEEALRAAGVNLRRLRQQ